MAPRQTNFPAADGVGSGSDETLSDDISDINVSVAGAGTSNINISDGAKGSGTEPTSRALEIEAIFGIVAGVSVRDYDYMISASRKHLDAFVISAECALKRGHLFAGMDRTGKNRRDLCTTAPLAPSQSVGNADLVLPDDVADQGRMSTVFVFAFSLTLVFFVERTVQVFAGTSAYAAVLTVFVGISMEESV
ncbi:hypothetical protein B0T14DRAFT_606648 [Immersiella caudata]|uniref:Uncharacterized protein n=1 Tax=Immersiella caudata TaxID=314043 RepID=A0AA39WFB6_9PEZI|nr:hypothetical protein B0T14DRAFT_606648 [Immersiella caudata]